MKYKFWNYYDYNPELSAEGVDPWNDKVYTINVPLLAVLAQFAPGTGLDCGSNATLNSTALRSESNSHRLYSPENGTTDCNAGNQSNKQRESSHQQEKKRGGGG